MEPVGTSSSGLDFGLLIMLERLFLRRVLERAPAVLGHLYLLLAVSMGWVLFEFESFAAGSGYLRAMLGLEGNAIWDTDFLYHLLSNGLLMIIMGLGATPLPDRLWQRFTAWLQDKGVGALSPSLTS